MEQTVAERPTSQEQHTGQLHMQHNGTVTSSGGQSEKNSLGRWCFRRSTVWRGSIPSDSFDGDQLGRNSFQRPVCRDNLRGSCVRGAFCKYQHSDSDGHDRSRFYHDERENLGAVANFGNSQIFRENQDSDSTSRFSSRGYRSRSPCRRFQSGRCYRGASCRYLHPESTSYDRMNHGSIVEQRQEDEAVRDSGFGGENRDNTLRISQEHGEADKENSSRPLPFSGEHGSRSPCRNFLRGKCMFGAFCKRWHPVTLRTSQEHDEANMHNHLRVGAFSRDPRSRSLCQSFLRGKCYRGASCVHLHPVTVHDRTRYDLWSVQQHQGAPANPHFGDGSIATPLRISLNHEGCKNHEIQPYRDMHVFERNKEWPTKDGMQLTGNRENLDVTSRNWSYQRQRGRSANDFGGDKRTREVCLQFTRGRCKSGELCRYLHGYHEYATSNWADKSYNEAAGHSRNFGVTNQNVNTIMAQEHADAKNYKMSLVESVHMESSQNGCIDKETRGRSVDDAIEPNILDRKVHVPTMVGYKREISGEKISNFCNSADNHEDISLWSRPFKRRRSSSQSPITPNNDFHCRNIREYDSRIDLRGGRCYNVGRFQYPDRHSYRYEKPMYHANSQQPTEGEAILVNPCSHECNDSKLVTPQRHDEVVSQDRQLDQRFRGSIGSNNTIVREKTEAEFAGCTSKPSRTDPNDGELATCSNAVDSITCAAAISQEVLGSDSTRSSEEHDVSPAAIDFSMLEEGPIGLNINMGRESNERSAELMPAMKTYSRNKRKKRGPKSASCEEILKEEVTDASEQGTPTTSLCNPNVVSVSGIPVERMKSASKCNDLENMDMHGHPVKQQKKKWKRKLLCVASCEDFMKEVVIDASNKGTPVSSLAETHSSNPNIVSVSGVPVDTEMSDPKNGNLVNVLVPDQSVQQKVKKKHRKKRTGSGVCDENKEEKSDVTEQGMAISSLVETSCSKPNIMPVTDVAVDIKMSASENNESENAVLHDVPVIRKVKKKRKKKCPGSGSFEENKKEEISDTSKQGMPISSLVETSWSTLNIVPVTGIVVDMKMSASGNNELENVLLHELPVIQKVKKKRKKMCPGSGSFEENKEQEVSDSSKQGMPISSLVETSSSKPNLVPVTGVAVDTNLSASENNELENVLLHHLPVIQKVKKHKKKCPGSGSFEENKEEEISDASKQGMPISSLVETSCSKRNIVPVTGVAVDTNLSASENNESENVLLHDLSVKQQENGCRTNKIEKNVEPALATTKDGTLVVGNTDGHSLQTLQYPLKAVVSRRKLLVLDVNGLLADIVGKGEYSCCYGPDIIVSGKGVFKRPCCDDFLQFCFERFDVGIWSSRLMKNLTKVVDFLMEDTKEKLLFCWDRAYCTQTRYSTLESRKKPLVLKELKHLWSGKRLGLPYYNETNTVLLDDSPYKALRNPPYTAIFPEPYTFKHRTDRALGPDGELRVYLERLAEADNVQKFIKENPFGQSPITAESPSWGFYAKIVGNRARQQERACITPCPDSPECSIAGNNLPQS